MRTAHLTAAETGAYIRLQVHYWMHGPIPEDDALLARITHLASTDLALSKHALKALFRYQDGAWHHDLLDHERERALNISRRASAGGKALSSARKAKHSLSTQQAPAKPSAKTVLNECTLPLHLHTHLPPQNPEPESAKSADSSSTPAADDGEFRLLPDDATNAAELETAELACREVFSYYLGVTGRNPRLYLFTPDRKKKGMQRFDEAKRIANGNTRGGIELMKHAVNEMLASDFHMGRDPKTGGKRFIEWEDHLFRNKNQFTKWLQRVADREAGQEKADV